ncbi:MAG: serine/threonine-protein kinase [Polyangiales bacterium]
MTGPRDGSGRAGGDARAHEETVLSTPDLIPVAEARPRRRKDDDIAPGTLLGGHYRVVKRLGGGAIGHVYEAINTWTTRRVALKLLRAELVDDADIAKRFLIEAQAATKVAHPHIVDILDMGKDPTSGHLYIVQEFLEGRDLHEHIQQRGRLTLLEATQVLVPVMQAVAAAHEKGVLHRDLKPENVFLVQSPDGHLVPKVIDFGLARTEASAGNRMTRTGAVMGTPYYMSPEQARGESGLDGRADVWALGVIWYEVLAGELPFTGDNLHQVLHAIFMSTPKRLDERVPEVADVIHRAFSRDLTVRYASVNDFIDAMLPVLPDDPLPQTGMRSSRPGRASTGPHPAASPQPSKVNTLPPPTPQAPSRPPPSQTPPPPSPPGDQWVTGPMPPTPPPEASAISSTPAPMSAPAMSPEAKRIRALYVVLTVAVTALLIVSAIAIQLMRREGQGSRVIDPIAPRPAVTPRATPADAATDAALDATTDAALEDAATTDAALDAALDGALPTSPLDASATGDAAVEDADEAAPEEDAGRHHRRSHRSRHGDSASSGAHHRHHRH